MWNRFLPTANRFHRPQRPCPTPSGVAMTRTCPVMLRVAVAVFCLSLCSSAPLLAQRADRAVISGVVADAQGSAVPGATVTVRNEATGVESVLVTNAAGAYTTTPLVLGTYSVTVDLTGFKKA